MAFPLLAGGAEQPSFSTNQERGAFERQAPQVLRIKIANVQPPTQSMPQESSHLIPITIYEIGNIISHILLMRKLRHREDTYLFKVTQLGSGRAMSKSVLWNAKVHGLYLVTTKQWTFKLGFAFCVYYTDDAMTKWWL